MNEDYRRGYLAALRDVEDRAEANRSGGGWRQVYIGVGAIVHDLRAASHCPKSDPHCRCIEMPGSPCHP